VEGVPGFSSGGGLAQRPKLGWGKTFCEVAEFSDVACCNSRNAEMTGNGNNIVPGQNVMSYFTVPLILWKGPCM
jgi:hypothetical protein